MKVLFIGGTGFISTTVSRMAIERGMELYLLNRGNRSCEISGAHQLTGDIHSPESMRNALKDLNFDVVVDWIDLLLKMWNATCRFSVVVPNSSFLSVHLRLTKSR